jgi:hypothetical protein
MIILDDNLWKGLKGGYKLVYDASVPLKQLEKATDKEEIASVFDELWNELHHQGDVGLASYLALPQLVRISSEKNLFDWNVLALCATIEQQRHLGNNPELPQEYSHYYDNGLMNLKEFILDNFKVIKDEITLTSALSALAACNGQVKLSKAIINLSEDVLDEFLQQY